MRDRGRTLVTLLSMLILAMSQTGFAQIAVSGRIGADLSRFGFDGLVPKDDSDIDYQIKRLISNQYLEFASTGPVKNSHFANYSVNARLTGVLYGNETGQGSVSTYRAPSISTYHGSLYLFPSRPYPLSLNFGKSLLYSLRYEPNNRSNIELLNPELGVVRRYESDMSELSARLQFRPGEGVEFSTEMKHSSNGVHRSYDYSENKDIWVDFLTISRDPTATDFRVTVTNSIPDDTVLLYIDLAFVDSLVAGENLDVILERGSHEVDFVPLQLNPYRVSVEVEGDMSWEVLHIAPAGSMDQKVVTDGFQARLQFGNEDHLKNETSIEITDADDTIQFMTTRMFNFDNSFSYQFSRDMNLTTRSMFMRNQSSLINSDSQINKSLSHESTVKWVPSRSTRASLNHKYTDMSSETGDIVNGSTLNAVDSRFRHATGWHGHLAEIRLGGQSFSDNSGDGNSQYSANLGNKIALHALGVLWTPQNQLKYSTINQESSASNVSEWETRFLLVGEQPEFGQLGSLNVSGEYSWRRLGDDVGSDTKKRYLFDFKLARSFFQDYKAAVATNQEWQVSGSSSPLAEGGGSTDTLTPETESRKSYRLLLQAMPRPGLNLSGNMNLITSNGTTILRKSFMFSFKIPKLKAPLSVIITDESRELVGLPAQSMTLVDTKLSLNFRKVRVLIIHSYVREKLIAGEFDYIETQIKISRDFRLYPRASNE